MNLFQSSMVIARRDFTATVMSKTFLLFLLGPVLALVFAGLLGMAGGAADRDALKPTVTVVGNPGDIRPVQRAYARLRERVSARAMPDLTFVPVDGAPAAQVRKLLAATVKSPTAVLTGLPASPRLQGPKSGLDRVEESIQLVLDEVRTEAAFEKAGVARPDIAVERTVLDPAGGGSSTNRHLIARLGQFLLLFITMLLAGMLLSQLVEEKSNKVIEVLAAAVPVDAIFFGKLTAMLGVSLVGIAFWAGLATAALVTLLPNGVPLPVPAVGWPLFGLLGILYYIMNYTLVGAVFLGVGGQANSAREVQTLSLPATMGQVVVFGLASHVVTRLADPIGIFAAIFPLSSPLTMLSYAAQRGEVWPHLLAVLWQGLWVYIIIRFGAARFRVTVLKSGPSATGKRRFGLGRVTSGSAATN